MKRCLYCLQPFKGRGRCCSEWCSRKVTGKSAWVTRSGRESVARIMEGLQRKVKHVPRFRQLAMGGDPAELLPAIFGTMPHEGPHRHGEYLDAP